MSFSKSQKAYLSIQVIWIICFFASPLITSPDILRRILLKLSRASLFQGTEVSGIETEEDRYDELTWLVALGYGCNMLAHAAIFILRGEINTKFMGALACCLSCYSTFCFFNGESHSEVLVACCCSGLSVGMLFAAATDSLRILPVVSWERYYTMFGLVPDFALVIPVLVDLLVRIPDVTAQSIGSVATIWCVFVFTLAALSLVVFPILKDDGFYKSALHMDRGVRVKEFDYTATCGKYLSRRSRIATDVSVSDYTYDYETESDDGNLNLNLPVATASIGGAAYGTFSSPSTSPSSPESHSMMNSLRKFRVPRNWSQLRKLVWPTHPGNDFIKNDVACGIAAAGLDPQLMSYAGYKLHSRDWRAQLRSPIFFVVTIITTVYKSTKILCLLNLRTMFLENVYINKLLMTVDHEPQYYVFGKVLDLAMSDRLMQIFNYCLPICLLGSFASSRSAYISVQFLLWVTSIAWLVGTFCICQSNPLVKLIGGLILATMAGQSINPFYQFAREFLGPSLIHWPQVCGGIVIILMFVYESNVWAYLGLVPHDLVRKEIAAGLTSGTLTTEQAISPEMLMRNMPHHTLMRYVFVVNLVCIPLMPVARILYDRQEYMFTKKQLQNKREAQAADAFGPSRDV